MIVLDEEAAAHNALGLERFAPAAPVVATEAEAAASLVPVSDRVAYMREYMRRKRETEAEAKKRGGS